MVPETIKDITRSSYSFWETTNMHEHIHNYHRERASILEEHNITSHVYNYTMRDAHAWPYHLIPVYRVVLYTIPQTNDKHKDILLLLFNLAKPGII